MEPKYIEEVLEAIWRLNRAVGKIHPDAKFEIKVDRLSKRILEDETFQHKRLPIEFSRANKITKVFGHKFDEIED